RQSQNEQREAIPEDRGFHVGLPGNERRLGLLGVHGSAHVLIPPSGLSARQDRRGRPPPAPADRQTVASSTATSSAFWLRFAPSPNQREVSRPYREPPA